MIVLIILVLVCWSLAAVCNAVMDVLAFKYKKSIFRNWNPDFWNPSRSWRNKYKNKEEPNGPAFFGSTTFLVFTTDAWHLFQFLSNSLIVLSIVLVFNHFANPYWWINLAIFAGLKVVWGSMFEWFYSTIFRIKKS